YLISSLFHLPTLSFLFRSPAPTALSTLSLHDALPICAVAFPVNLESAGDGVSLQSRRFWRCDEPLAFPGDAPKSASGKRRKALRSEEHTSELQSRENLVCRLLLEKKNEKKQEAPCTAN